MRHFIGYTADTEEWLGVHHRTEARTGLNGWPENFELDNANTQDRESQEWLADWNLRHPGQRLFRYDCACPRSSRACSCATTIQSLNYVQHGQLCPRLETVVTVDGARVLSGQVIHLRPGQGAVLRVSVPGAPDGELVHLGQRVPQVLDTVEPSTSVPLVGGQTEEIHMTGPAQGFLGTVRVTGRICKMVEVRVRGWAES